MDEYLSNVLYVDLDKGDTEVRNREDIFKEYLGGVGASVELYEEEGKRNADPFDPESPLIFAVGPLTALYPCISKAVCSFKSPANNTYAESYAGGRLAMSLRMAGYGAIVIKGKSEDPVYLAVHGDDVEIKNGSAIWGMKSTYAKGRVLREVEPKSGKRSIVRIGPAGENKVKYANAVAETFRHFGRHGIGAVMGSKKLSALVVSADKEIPIADKDQYMKLYQDVYDEVTESSAMEKYRVLGTPKNVKPLNELGGLPTKNFSAGEFEHAGALSGEYFAEHQLAKQLACIGCPLGCIHLATLRKKFASGHEYETILQSYDYEPIYALGSLLGVSSAHGVLELIERVDSLGLDALSTGVALAWATEAMKKGIIDKGETGGLMLEWDDVESYRRAIENIARQTNEFYETLGQGVRKAGEKYGGKEFAISIAGLEPAGYHTGPSYIASLIVGARHHHCDCYGYGIDQKMADEGLEEEVEKMTYEDRFRNVLESLTACLFARDVYDEERVVKALKTVGIDRNKEDLKKLGEKIQRKKWSLKKEEGFNLEDIEVPERLLETPSPRGKIDEKEIWDRVEGWMKKSDLEDVFSNYAKKGSKS